MSDLATIEQRIRAENPVFKIREDKRDVFVNAADFPAWYEELIAEQVAREIEAEARETVETEHKALRTKLRKARTELAIPVTQANGQVRLTNTRVIVRELIEFLINQGLIEREDEAAPQ